MTVEPYTPTLKAEWDRAVSTARNSLFQHRRDYMDYHADRFADCSLIGRDDHGRIIAVLPAHAAGTTVCSHRGLSFGGWLMDFRADMPAMMELWRLAAEHYRAGGFTELFYRPAPYIYSSYPAEEDLYALWRAGGRLTTTLVSSVIDAANAPGFDLSYRQRLRKAEKAGIEVRRSDDYATFWAILTDILARYHKATPVHTLAEIELLHSRFPDEIRLYGAYLGDEMLAGIVVYRNTTVTHAQYTACSEHGRKLNALQPIVARIIADTAAEGIRWFDLGTSNEDGGNILNEGLIRQKCAYGARAVAFNSYTIPLL